jgi:hypothetical protein
LFLARACLPAGREYTDDEDDRGSWIQYPASRIPHLVSRVTKLLVHLHRHPVKMKKHKKVPEPFNDINEAREPDHVYADMYGSSGIAEEIVISGPEQQEEDNYIYWSNLTPAQRLQLHCRLIRKIYGIKQGSQRSAEPLEIIITDGAVS